MTYYECHVTMLGDPDHIQPKVTTLGWKFSRIDGDPVLGDGVKCYATRHYNARLGQEQVIDHLLEAARWLMASGARVVRRKVELVIFDDRSTKVNCAGACPECHLDDYTCR